MRVVGINLVGSNPAVRLANLLPTDRGVGSFGIDWAPAGAAGGVIETTGEADALVATLVVVDDGVLCMMLEFLFTLTMPPLPVDVTPPLALLFGPLLITSEPSVSVTVAVAAGAAAVTCSLLC